MEIVKEIDLDGRRPKLLMRMVQSRVSNWVFAVNESFQVVISLVALEYYSVFFHLVLYILFLSFLTGGEQPSNLSELNPVVSTVQEKRVFI